jgi:alkylation response protein AidB-like acyl-CoA dehydrogenase
MTDPAIDPAALRESVRDVLARECDSRRLHALVDQGAPCDLSLWRIAADLGWNGLAVSEDHGGLGLGVTETAVVFEEMGRALAALPYLGAVLAARAISVAGSPDQQARWLPAIAAGDLLCAVSHPDQSATVRLQIGADRIILSGECADLLQGADTGLLVIEVREADGAASYVMVEPQTDGVELILERTVDRTRHLTRVRFEDTALPLDRRLASAPFAKTREALRLESALAIACDSIGGAKAVFAATIDYLKNREQFGKPIGAFQALKHRCADHQVTLAAAGAVIAEAVRLAAQAAASAPMMAALAKAYACEVYAKVAEDAVQLHGGIGFTWEHDCHLFLKRAKLNQALLNGTAAQLDRAADLLLAM